MGHASPEKELVPHRPPLQALLAYRVLNSGPGRSEVVYKVELLGG